MIQFTRFEKAMKKSENGWRFSEAHWYCRTCGIVSAKDVQTDSDEPKENAETGTCRCGKEIGKTTF